MKRVVLLIGLQCILFSLSAQYVGVYEPSESNCNYFIRDKNWPEGASCFSQLLEEDTANQEFKYKLAKCYTYANINDKKALVMMKSLLDEGLATKEFREDYGMAEFHNNNFDEAEKIFSDLMKNVSDEDVINRLTQMIEQCRISKKIIQSPVYVEFENLGKYVNSEAPDFLPVVSEDESNVYFTTKRNGVVGNVGSSEGYKTADIYYSKHLRNRYSRARSVGSPNTFGNEYTAGKSENSNYIIYTVNNDDFFNDIFISEMGRRSYMAPELLNKDDLKKTRERGAALSNDGEKLYFSSDREGGQGGFDLWFMQKLPNGNWSEPINLGSTINTEKDEKYPVIMNEGKTLYFSSAGHKGMGGMDLYKSIGGLTKWSQPQNLGYPINSTRDELNISFPKNERFAYMAKNLDDSFGSLDIYRLTFPEKKDKYSLLYGRVINTDSTAIKESFEINVFNESDGELVGTYLSNRKNGKYSAILAPGIYMIEVAEQYGYGNFEKSITINDKNDQQEVEAFDIQLKLQ